METFEEIDTLIGHEQAVCALTASRQHLFSGSNKCIKVGGLLESCPLLLSTAVGQVWTLGSHEQVCELAGLNHWVRAMTCSDESLLAGTYASVSVCYNARMHACLSTGCKERCCWGLDMAAG